MDLAKLKVKVKVKVKVRVKVESISWIVCLLYDIRLNVNNRKLYVN